MSTLEPENFPTLSQFFDEDDWQEQVETSLKALAQQRPEFVYKPIESACYYANGDNCHGCIFGQALAMCGIPQEEISQLDKLESSAIDKVLEFFGLICPEKWESVQMSQDNSNDWKSSVSFL